MYKCGHCGQSVSCGVVFCLRMNEAEIKLLYPLHHLVWHNDKQGLARFLSEASTQTIDLEQKDPRGRSALMLAVTLGRKACTSILIKHSASVDTDDSTGFTALQEVLVDGNKKFYRYLQRKFDHQLVANLINELFQSFVSAQDFYIEVELNFSTWVPFVGFLLPNDKITIYKRGSQFRIDNNLVMNDDEVGLAHAPWKRGQNTMLIQLDQREASFCDIDHRKKEIFKVMFTVGTKLSDKDITQARDFAIHSIQLQVDKVQVEPIKSSGIFGTLFQSERTELLSSYQCKVYSVSNLEVSHRTRVEHMPSSHKQRLASSPVNTFLSVLGIATTQVSQPLNHTKESNRKVKQAVCKQQPRGKRNPHRLSLVEYFNSATLHPQNDIGRARELLVRSKCSKGLLWMAGEEFPLSVSDHLVPVLKLLSIYNPYYKCVLSFITDKLPDGFPLKMEFSLLQLLTVRITFGNEFASKQTVPGVQCLTTAAGRIKGCVVESNLFDLPEGYTNVSY